MTTKLEGELRRELLIGREPYTLTVSPTGFTLALKGRRKGLEINWADLVSGEDGSCYRPQCIAYGQHSTAEGGGASQAQGQALIAQSAGASARQSACNSLDNAAALYGRVRSVIGMGHCQT